MSDADALAVLKSRLHRALKPVALAFACHANHESHLMCVSFGKVAKYLEVTRRWVAIVAHELERLGVLVPMDPPAVRYGTARHYTFDTERLDVLPAGGHSGEWKKVRTDGRTFPVGHLRRTVRTSVRADVRTTVPATCELQDTDVRTTVPERANCSSPEQRTTSEQTENPAALRAGSLSHSGENPNQSHDDGKRGGFEQVREVMARMASLPPLPRRSRAAQARRPMGPGARAEGGEAR